MITGSSVHNQRVERLHRDFVEALKAYTSQFREMEGQEILDPLNEIHLFSLHVNFIDEINNHLLNVLINGITMH